MGRVTTLDPIATGEELQKKKHHTRTHTHTTFPSHWKEERGAREQKERGSREERKTHNAFDRFPSLSFPSASEPKQLSLRPDFILKLSRRKEKKSGGRKPPPLFLSSPMLLNPTTVKSMNLPSGGRKQAKKKEEGKPSPPFFHLSTLCPERLGCGLSLWIGRLCPQL